MPRIKPKGEKKMLKLKSLSELASVKLADVPAEAFAPKLEVPEGAFENAASKSARYYFPAYVKYLTTNDKAAGRSYEYAHFVFTSNFLKKHFKKYEVGQKFELVQGNAPHNDWFMLRRGSVGNVSHGGGVNFNTRYLKKFSKAAYELETIAKDGNVYVKLPAELVPLLRKG